MTIFADAHAHFSLIQQPHDEVCSRAYHAGIQTIVNVSIDVTALQHSFMLETLHPEIHWIHAAATPPHDKDAQFIPYIESHIDHIHAIGECGLDYFHMNTSKEQQQEIFRHYLTLARIHQKPVVVHCRDALDDCLAIIRTFPSVQGMLHCFTGTYEQACQLIDMGWYISFSGLITHKRQEALRDICAKLPLSHILIETDAPYLTPEPLRGKANEPAYIVATADVIATCLKKRREDVAEHTVINTHTLFHRADHG